MKKTTEEFINQAKAVHGDKYSYEKVVYINNGVKVEIYCNTCKKYFLVRPTSHLRGNNCITCSFNSTAIKNRLSIEEIKEKVNKIGNNEFEVNTNNYENQYSELEFKHSVCGHTFKRKLINFLVGGNCPFCFKYPIKSNELFIKQAKLVHKDKYSYKETDYKGSSVKVKIYCNTCNEYFYIIPSNFLFGSGCKKCGRTRANKITALTKKQFIEKAKSIHNDHYDYSSVEYINNHTKVKIYCNVCKEYLYIIPSNHLSGKGCIKCHHNNMKRDRSFTKEQFIEKAKLVHGDKYDYSLVEYTNARNKVKIICPIHGEFEQEPMSHNKGCGCKQCNTSKGEMTIENFLNKHNIQYKIEYTFDDCRNDKTNFKLKFDFYLPELNTCVEFDGKHHFEPVNFSSNLTDVELEVAFDGVQYRDKLKDKYCLSKGIKLIRIPYFDIDKIESILSKELN